MLTFDKVTHTYYWNGTPVPGVTSILKPVYNFDRVPAASLEAARRRGTYVHRMTELFDLGLLDIEANARVQDGAFVGYLRAWRDFLEEYEFQPLEIEAMGYCPLGFAGTWDRWGIAHRKRPGHWLIDIKTALTPHRAWGLQTAAYRFIRAQADPQSLLAGRATVQLFADGAFAFEPWNDPTDLEVFRALLARQQADSTINRWMEAQ